MKVLVCSRGPDLDSDASPVFGRSDFFLLVDSSSFSFESFDNPGRTQESGAGVMAAQFVLDMNPTALIAASIGPKAFNVLSSVSLPCYRAQGRSVREEVESFVAGSASRIEASSRRS